MSVRRKISTENIYRLIEPFKTSDPVLIIHSEDVSLDHLFPNAYAVTKRADIPDDMHVDDYYEDLRHLPESSQKLVICTGLLEHVPNPQALIDNIFRILEPGGTAVLQASSAFSVHEAPNNFFQFLPYGMKYLFRGWRDVRVTASCGPYETIAILLQRIAYQTKSNFFIKTLTVLLANLFLFFDRFIEGQWGSMHRNAETSIDSMLASNIQVVAKK